MDVFISFASEDREWADRIKVGLKSLEIDAFVAPNDLQIGVDFHEEIRKELEKARLVVLVLTQRSAESFWVRTEQAAAWALRKPIIPVLVEGSITSLPDYFANLHVYEFSANQEERKGHLAALPKEIQKQVFLAAESPPYFEVAKNLEELWDTAIGMVDAASDKARIYDTSCLENSKEYEAVINRPCPIRHCGEPDDLWLH